MCRTQYVRAGSAVSSLLLITHGAPQGIIISPLLFGVHLYDQTITLLQASSLDSYVDDSKISLSFAIKEVEQVTQKLANFEFFKSPTYQSRENKMYHLTNTAHEETPV